jgi:Cdc6-like AAA superfamily ATPase
MESASYDARDSASDAQTPTLSTTNSEEIPTGKSDEPMLDRSPESDNKAIVASNCAPLSEKKSSPSCPGRNMLPQFDRTMNEHQTEKARGEVADSGVAETSDSEQESAVQVVEVITLRSSTRGRETKPVEVAEARKIENKKQPHTEKPSSADKDRARNEVPTLPTSPPKSLPDLETTVGAKLQKCKEMLKLASGEITFGIKRSKTTERIMQFLRAVIRSKGEHGGKTGEPAALHVCGVPGTGKTMTVDWCCNKALKSAKESAEEWEKAPTYCRINGSHYQNLTKKIALDDVKEALSTSMGQAFSEKAVKRSKNAEKSAVILVIDEIDLLVSSDKSENFLSTLLGWASNEQMTFGIIGISNSVDNSKARRLHNLGVVSTSFTSSIQRPFFATDWNVSCYSISQFKDKVVFQTYDKDELVNIVQSRIGSIIVDSKVIEFIASKVAATSGDARKVLEMTSKAIDKCIEKMPKTRRDTNEEGTIVKLPFAMMAIRENITKYADLINGLPLMAKSVLCVATRLARHVDISELTLGTLKSYCMDAFGHDAMLGEVSMEDFKSLVENLVDGGLLCVAECDRKRLSTESLNILAMIPIRLDLQLEDVESAVDEELLKQDFYSSLLARLASRGRG